MQMKKVDEAISHFQKAVALNKNSAKSFMMLGTLYAAKNQFELAKQNFLKVIDLEPQDAIAYHSLAYLHGQCDRVVGNPEKNSAQCR